MSGAIVYTLSLLGLVIFSLLKAFDDFSSPLCAWFALMLCRMYSQLILKSATLLGVFTRRDDNGLEKAQ